MGVNSLPKTATRQRRDCDLNPGPSAPESSTLTTRLPSQPSRITGRKCEICVLNNRGDTITKRELCCCLIAKFTDILELYPSLHARRPSSLRNEIYELSESTEQWSYTKRHTVLTEDSWPDPAIRLGHQLLN